MPVPAIMQPLMNNEQDIGALGAQGLQYSMARVYIYIYILISPVSVINVCLDIII